ncbi:MAG: endonuclease/exonuclease/phosphatase family protein [Bacteroidota bacterium]
MPKPIGKLLRILAILCLIGLLMVAGFFLFLTLTEFSPPPKSTPVINGKGKMMDRTKREFTFFTWNIGYAGLGKEMDFFYEGGTLVMPGKEQFDRYFAGIKKTVLANDTADFIFLQEVDVRSKRSWFFDEYAALSEKLFGFFNIFSQNYGCRYIPVPLRDPMGRVKAGLATFTKLKPESARVQYFKTDMSWPKRLAFLKRCFILLRFPLDNGKELVVLNTHNSAYDSTGVWLKKELAMLDSAMQAEFQRGNYVVAGGDWNSNPRGYATGNMISGDRATLVDPQIEPDFAHGWEFVFDPRQPSNRAVDKAYRKGITKTTLIDFFVVSPNIEVTQVHTIPLGFTDSDHNPVVMTVRLK